MGQNVCSATDYMLETMSFVCYLLVNYYILNLCTDVKKNNCFFKLKSENNSNTDTIKINWTDIQSAENCKGFPETIRQLSNNKNNDNLKFFQWLAGVFDGNGYFDIKNSDVLDLKSIKIKIHNRDVRVLVRIRDYLRIGRIRSNKNKFYSIFIVSTKKEMKLLIYHLNGFIRIKVPEFKKSCEIFDIRFIEPDYTIKKYNPYFAGLIDAKGNIVYNYSGNRIECNLEMKDNEFTKKLVLSNVIPHCKPYIIRRTHKIFNKIYYSVAFKFQNIDHMIHIYDFFMKNRLYSDFKFYRISKIKFFILLRNYKNYTKNSLEYIKYKEFILKWLQYKNPYWYKLSCIDKIR